MIYINDQIINDKLPNGDFIVIGADGSRLGIFPKVKVLAVAKQSGLDAVLMNANSNPKVVRLMDHSKQKFENEKRKKENVSKQVRTKNKEIQLRSTIAEHDMRIKANQTIKFLEKGHRVNVILTARGRMLSKEDYNLEVFNKFLEMLNNTHRIDGGIKNDSGRISAVLLKNNN